MCFKVIIIILNLLFCTCVYAQGRIDINMPSVLAEALKNARDGKIPEALTTIKTWAPKDDYQKEYKLYWENIWSGDLDAVWAQYKKLKIQKKFIRIRLDLFNRIIQASDTEIQKRKTFTDVQIKKEAPVILRQLSGTSEGEIIEANYLKWVQKNKYYEVVCRRERRRWITQPDIEFSEIQLGVAKCPLAFEDFLLRVRRLIFAAREAQAQKEIETYTTSEKSLKPFEKAYVQAVFDSNVGDPLAALNSLSKYEDDLIASDFAENYFYISQRAGELEKSEAILNKIIQHYKKTGKNVSELLFQRGFLFYQNRKYAEAHKVFDQLFDKEAHKKKKKRKRSGLNHEQIAWLRAWTLYLKNDLDKALAAFNEMRSYTSDSTRLSYWIAMCYQRLEQPLTALQLFKKSSESLINNETYTYYNLLSWVRYQELRSKNAGLEKNTLIKDLLEVSRDRNAIYPIPSDEVSREQIKKLYSFILSESSGDEDNAIAVVNDENEVIFSDENKGIVVETEAELKRHIGWSQFLIGNNQHELAKWHLYELEKNLRFSKNSKLLIEFYTEHGFYYRALSLAQQQTPGQKMSFEKDTFLLKSIYPEAYKDNVFKYAKQRKIDPYIVLSIMKAETQYKSDAISPVGAVGLMQFMPYTLDKLSNLVGDTVKVTDLFEPKKAIKYGAVYLKKLFLELDNQSPLTAAAYNGGPHRVKSWIKKLGDIDYDVFIEHIPFAETRTYVKRVITFRSIYSKLYQKKDINDLKYLTKAQPVKIEGAISLKEEWDPFRDKLKETNNE